MCCSASDAQVPDGHPMDRRLVLAVRWDRGPRTLGDYSPYGVGDGNAAADTDEAMKEVHGPLLYDALPTSSYNKFSRGG